MQSPYVLPSNEAVVARHNCKYGEKHRFHLYAEQLLPEPFIGDRFAPVLLLSNNPGVTGKGLP